MGEILDSSIQKVVEDTLAAPLAPFPDRKDWEGPFMASEAATNLVARMSIPGKFALLLEGMDEPEGAHLDLSGNGEVLLPELIDTTCVKFLEEKARLFPEVIAREEEQWAAFEEAYPHLA